MRWVYSDCTMTDIGGKLGVDSAARGIAAKLEAATDRASAAGRPCDKSSRSGPSGAQSSARPRRRCARRRKRQSQEARRPWRPPSRSHVAGHGAKGVEESVHPGHSIGPPEIPLEPGSAPSRFFCLFRSLSAARPETAARKGLLARRLIVDEAQIRGDRVDLGGRQVPRTAGIGAAV